MPGIKAHLLGRFEGLFGEEIRTTLGVSEEACMAAPPRRERGGGKASLSRMSKRKKMMMYFPPPHHQNFQQTVQFIHLLYQGSEDEEDTCQHPGLDGSQSLCFGRVRCHRVENVDQHKEEGDEQRHSARDDVHRDEERDPRHDEHHGYAFARSGNGRAVPRLGRARKAQQPASLAADHDLRSMSSVRDR